MSGQPHSYYLPEPSPWPLVGSFGLFFTLGGLALLVNDISGAPYVMGFGFVVLLVMVFGWFGTVIREGQAGKYNEQVDKSFRWGMAWFIVSELMFFAGFFGALFYARMYSVPWLGGVGEKLSTHAHLWPGFESVWPLLTLPSAAGYTEALEPMGAWGLPAINTLILLSSGVTVTAAHWGLVHANRRQLIVGLALTVALGVLFLVLQGLEYTHAYRELGLKITSGIYGSTFFMLTGFHGFHVTLGAVMLAVILFRAMAGHFTPDNHFAFEAAAWYWHFVDVVWLLLFVFVYWL